jgi:hypothetical protein
MSLLRSLRRFETVSSINMALLTELACADDGMTINKSLLAELGASISVWGLG